MRVYLREFEINLELERIFKVIYRFIVEDKFCYNWIYFILMIFFFMNIF